ncbi:MAG: hypothetical protein R2882_08510 [Gemmatimonadales bacterium]
MAASPPSGTASCGRLGSRRAMSCSWSSELAHLGIERLDLLARLLEPGEQVVCGFLGLLPPGHFLARRVALGLERLDLGQRRPPPPVQFGQGVGGGFEGGIEASKELLPETGRVLPKQLEVDHFSGRPGKRPR